MPASSAAHSRETLRAMQQKNCMFCAIAHVLFKKPVFSHFRGFIGLNNARKYCFPAQGWQPLPDVFCRLFLKTSLPHASQTCAPQKYLCFNNGRKKLLYLLRKLI
jgi:hypothetical protein